MRHQPNQLVLGRISNHAERIASLLHRFHAFLIEPAQQNNAFVGCHQMLRSPVEDRSLALLCRAVLIFAGKPADLVVPAIFPRTVSCTPSAERSFMIFAASWPSTMAPNSTV